MSVESVFPKVKEVLADVLAIDEDTIELKSSLIKNLGAESIDFLDMVFRLEREFKIKIPRGKIENEARGTLPADQFEQGGVITPAGLVALKNYLSEVPESAFKATMKVNEIPTLFTVETMCKLVVNAQAQQAQATT